MAADKTRHEETSSRFQGLRRSMERDWTPGLQALLDIEATALPVRGMRFLRSPRATGSEDSFVLCEINISCVAPFPATAAPRIAAAAKALAAAYKATTRGSPSA